MYKTLTNQNDEIYVTDMNEMLALDAVTEKELENVVSDLESVIDTKYDKTSAEQEHYELSEKIDAEESRAVAKETDLLNTIQDEITTRTQENTEITKDISSIINKIPNQASSTNQLADKEFVNNAISSSASTFKGSFSTKAALDAVQWQTTDPSLNTYVANNDYAHVESDETHNNESWRYIYVKNNTTSEWQAQFKVNDSPFTSEQLAAINSGATSELINSISSKLDQEDIVDLTGNSSTKAISQRAATSAVQNVQNEFLNYLPLTAGSTKPLTNILYVDEGIRVGSQQYIRFAGEAKFITPSKVIRFGSTADTNSDLLVMTQSHLRPNGNNTTLGNSSNQWKEIYGTTIYQSDKQVANKEDVEIAVSQTLGSAKDYTDTKIADLINSAPETLDTLGEVANAIQEHEDVVTALNSSIGNKADKDSLNNYLLKTGGKMEGDINLSTNKGFSATTTSGNVYDIFKVDSANRRLTVGGSYPALQLKGLNARPTYNGSEVALLSDVSTSSSNKIYEHRISLRKKDTSHDYDNFRITFSLYSSSQNPFTNLASLIEYLDDTMKVSSSGEKAMMGLFGYLMNPSGSDYTGLIYSIYVSYGTSLTYLYFKINDSKTFTSDANSIEPTDTTVTIKDTVVEL